MTEREPVEVDGVLLGVGEDEGGHAFLKLRLSLEDALRLMEAGAFLQRVAVRFPAAREDDSAGEGRVP